MIGCAWAKAAEQLFTLDESSDEEAALARAQLQRIEAILFPAGVKDRNQENDVQIVYTAAKWNATLVTNDGGSKTQPGGILGNREALRGAVGVEIMSPAVAVSFVREKITERDQHNVKIAARVGSAPPDWTGQD